MNITSSTLQLTMQAVGGNNSTADATDFAAVGGAEGGALYNELGNAGTISGCIFDHNEAGRRQQRHRQRLHRSWSAKAWEARSFRATAATSMARPRSPSATAPSPRTAAQGGDNNTGSGSVAGLVGTGAGAGIANYAGGPLSSAAANWTTTRPAAATTTRPAAPGLSSRGVGTGGGIFNSWGITTRGYGQFNASVGHRQQQHLDGQPGPGGRRHRRRRRQRPRRRHRQRARRHDHRWPAVSSPRTGPTADGRAGLGGGAYNDATSTLALTDSLVTENDANGSPGIGGGIYTLGTFSYDSSTVIKDNHASTSGDNIGP